MLKQPSPFSIIGRCFLEFTLFYTLRGYMLEDKNKYINVPNFLTLLRFLMIGVMVWFFLNDHPIYAMIVFVVAVLTDFLDGYIARRFNQITNIGKLLDPLADKLLQIAAIFCMFWVGYLPLIAFILVVLCEVLMVYGASFLLLHRPHYSRCKLIRKNIRRCYVRRDTRYFPTRLHSAF